MKFQVSSTRFIGEQDGKPEQELKARFVAAFAGNRMILTAYLARVAYGDAQSHVALCLRTAGADHPNIVRSIGKVFEKLFGSSQSLDIIFLTDPMEAKLKQVCMAFYSRIEGQQG